ncbi:MAG: phospholipase D-like domain-containing protein, partial [Planctomycetia bacterium]
MYESLLTNALHSRLADLGEKYQYDCEALDSEEAADRLALHLSKLFERSLAHLEPKQRVAAGVSLTRRLVAQIIQDTGAAHLADQSPLETGQLLRAIGQRLPDGRMEEIVSPLLSLLDTTLLTNAPGEPRVGSQIVTEIESADRIEVVMAFIRMSGIAPMLEALKKHCAAGRLLSVLTTTYTGSTEAEALDTLTSVGAQVRVSYDESSTRLHANAWLFHRSSGFTTAYIGSSNLTHSAQVSGLEWNLRVSNARNSVVIDKMSAVFASYWNGGDFVSYAREEFLQRIQQSDDRIAGLIMSP